MGIVNVTLDSFYAPSRTFNPESIQRRVTELLEQRADIIDIGAYSTRPGAFDISEDEELRRLERGMQIVRDIASDAIVSVDTFRARVAHIAVTQFGCDIVNDISGGNLDARMFETVAVLNVPYVLTHGRGTPADMNTRTEYSDVVADVMRELSEKINRLELSGVKDIIIDPGFGFAKTREQNYKLAARLHTFELFRRPILVGVSNKSLLSNLPDVTTSEDLSACTTALHAFCLDRGASILRVHDVAAARRCITVYNQLLTK